MAHQAVWPAVYHRCETDLVHVGESEGKSSAYAELLTIGKLIMLTEFLKVGFQSQMRMKLSKSDSFGHALG